MAGMLFGKKFITTWRIPVLTALIFIFISGQVYAVSFIGARSFYAGWGQEFVTTGDFNGDGKADLAVVGDNIVSVLMCNGDGTFADAVVHIIGSNAASAVTEDFNGDGKDDLAVVFDSAVSVLINNGDGTFAAAVNYAAGTFLNYVTSGDFNNDGKADLAVVSSSFTGNVSVLINNGDGTFATAVTFTAGSNLRAVTSDDFNGDGKADLALVGGGNVSVLINNGDGTFAPAVNYNAGSSLAVTTGDFNGDGKVDLATAGSDNFVSVLINNGNGTFAAAVDYAAGSHSVITGDFNGDGKADLASADWFNSKVAVLLGNGDGTFDAAVYYAAGKTPYSVATGDFNMDGKADLAVAVFYSMNVSVLTGNGDGTFSTAVHYAVGTSTGSAASADFSGDGKDDLAVGMGAPGTGRNISIFTNNGNGTFAAAVNYSVVGDYAMTTGDFNDDGKADLAVTNYNNGNYLSVLINNGDGTFGAAAGYPMVSPSYSVITGDFNNDGKTDLVTANYYYGDNVSVFLGNGNGSFAAAVNSAVAAGGYPASVTTGDFNGDGKADLATANRNRDNVSVLLGNGNGTFSAPGNYAVGLIPRSVTTGDFNGDGKADLAVSNSYSDTVSVLPGNGNGTFGAPLEVPVDNVVYTSSGPTFVDTADLNGDGKADLLVVLEAGNYISIFINNGDGTFGAPVNYVAGLGDYPANVTTGDFNSDGKVDLAVTNGNSGGVAVLINAMLRIVPSASPHGSIACSPWMVDPKGNSTCTITPDAGYMISDVVVNGSSVGVVASYTFSNVTTDQTISATFAAIPPATGATLSASPSSSQPAGIPVTFTGGGSGGSGTYEYQFWRKIDGVMTRVRDYSAASTWVWDTTGVASGTYFIQVRVRNAGTTTPYDAIFSMNYKITLPSVSGLTMAPTPATFQVTGGTVSFKATGSGGSGSYEYQFWRKIDGVMTMVQAYSSNDTWTWNTSGIVPGTHFIQVRVRNAGKTNAYDIIKSLNYKITWPPVSGLVVTPTPLSPQAQGTQISFQAVGSGGSGSYEYQFWRKIGGVMTMVQSYSTSDTYNWDTTSVTPGTHFIQVRVRNAGYTNVSDVIRSFNYVITAP